MNESEIRVEVIRYWMNKAYESSESARSEQKAGRFTFAVNRACFYAASSVLMRMGKTYRKHTGVRAGVQSELVRPGLLDASWGKFYALVFKSRQRGDYQELVEFSGAEADELISKSEELVKIFENILNDL